MKQLSLENDLAAYFVFEKKMNCGQLFENVHNSV